jgi:CheY-like chemotaxis protein
MTKRVLVVEDDRDMRTFVNDVLSWEGYTVETAVNGSDAVRRLGAHAEPPSVIVLDLAMPGMDGREFRRWQVGHPEVADVPVVVFSAERDAACQAEALRATACLRKPVRLEELVGVVRRLSSSGPATRPRHPLQRE